MLGCKLLFCFFFSHFISSFEDFIVSFKWKEVMDFNFNYFFPGIFFVLFCLYFCSIYLSLYWYCFILHFRMKLPVLMWLILERHLSLSQMHMEEKTPSMVLFTLCICQVIKDIQYNPPPTPTQLTLSTPSPPPPPSCNSKMIPFWVIYYQVTWALTNSKHFKFPLGVQVTWGCTVRYFYPESTVL